jgi:hypothetical protein
MRVPGSRSRDRRPSARSRSSWRGRGEVNASGYAYRVGRVIAFGSFLSDSPTLGDVDLSIELEDPYRTAAEREAGHNARIEAALQASRHFGDYMQMLRWPEQEVLLKLKNRSPSLSLHYEWRERVLERELSRQRSFSMLRLREAYKSQHEGTRGSSSQAIGSYEMTFDFSALATADAQYRKRNGPSP